MPLKIYYYGHPILRKRCAPVKEITDEIRKLAQDMIDTMDENNGIGLAAPQVGHSIRMFVLRNYIFHEEGHWTLSEPQVYINPKLINPSEQFVSDTEGCLSLPGLRLQVDRPDKITVEAMDLDGNRFTEELEGYNARVRMHENDHINGVLFIDRVDINTRKKIDPILKEIKKRHPIAKG
jgi:peptide deformylase